jgi:hypothetical protein
VAYSAYLGHLCGVEFVTCQRSFLENLNMGEARDGKNYIFLNQDRGGHHERVQDAHRYNAQAASNLSCGGRDGEKLERKECTKVLSPIA